MAKIIFSTTARKDMNEIAEVYLELAGEASSRRITERILDAVSRLEDFPLSGHPMMEQELHFYGFRYVLAEKYLCVYRYTDTDDSVFIYRILNGTTNYVRTLMKLVK